MSTQSQPLLPLQRASGVMPRSGRLVTALTRLAATAASDFTIDNLLRTTCHAAVDVMGISGAGAMLLQDQRLRYVLAHPTKFETFGRLQEALQRGPCRDSVHRRRPVVVEDVTGARRWPELAAASRPAGLRSVVSVPMVARGRPLGALDFYRSNACPWSPADLRFGTLLADLAASYVSMAGKRDGRRPGDRIVEP